MASWPSGSTQPTTTATAFKMLRIRLNVPEDFGLKAVQIREIKDKIRNLLINSEKTSAYFPHILFNLQTPAGAEA